MRLIWRFRDDSVLRPWWLGLCWHEDYNQVTVAAPLGLNVLFALVRTLYRAVAFRISWWLIDRHSVSDVQFDCVRAAHLLTALRRSDWVRPRTYDEDDALDLAIRELLARATRRQR